MAYLIETGQTEWFLHNGRISRTVLRPNGFAEHQPEVWREPCKVLRAPVVGQRMTVQIKSQIFPGDPVLTSGRITNIKPIKIT